MNKALIVQKILAALAEELERYARSARSAHAEATDEQSKAENKYDTRGLEASYLARGQSSQAAEVLQAIQRFEALELRDFAAKEPIDIGAVVELERKGGNAVYFVGPRAGGVEVEVEGRPVLVITPQSALGQQLAGRCQGERLQIRIGGASEHCRIVRVG